MKDVDAWSIGQIVYFAIECRPAFSKLEDIGKAITFKEDTKLSIAGKDFLRKVLEKNPQSRLSVDCMMGHPWLKDVSGNCPSKIGFAKHCSYDVSEKSGKDKL